MKIIEKRNRKEKAILILVCMLSTCLAFLYVILHPTIGIDDTEIGRYVFEGWEPLFNRPTMALFGLVLNFTDYISYVYDIVGAILLGLSALIFCMVWNEASDKKVRLVPKILFCSLFVTSPLICETYIFYLHNGSGFAFCITALSCWFIIGFFKKKKIYMYVVSCILLCLAVGCYESFAIVYLVSVLFSLLLFEKYKTEVKAFVKNKPLNCLIKMLLTVFPMGMAMAARSLSASLIPKVLNFNPEGKIVGAHSSSFKYWFMNNPIIILKDILYKFVLRYVLSATYFHYIKIFLVVLLALFAIALAGFIKKMWKQSILVLLLILAPWALIIPMMDMLPYRVSLGLMVFIAVGALFTTEYIIERLKEKSVIVNIVLIAVIIVTAGLQCSDGYNYYHLDYDVYMSDIKYCEKLYNELSANYDLNKQVYFVGQYSMPEELARRAYVSSDITDFYHMGNRFDITNTKAFSYYCDENGYQKYDIGHVDPLTWAYYACPSMVNGEIYDFMNMNGMNIHKPEETDSCTFEETVPNKVWPEDDSIFENDEMIVVRIGNTE